VREVLVIGGGLAGAAVASHLSSAGRDVRLVEREAGPKDKVCGDFLSREAMVYLGRLGIDPVGALGAPPIEALRVSRRDRVAETALPFGAASVSRRVLDEAVLTRAAQSGVEVSRGRRVTSLQPSGQAFGKGWMATLSDGETIAARTVFLATGKHDVHGHSRQAGGHDDLVALKMHFRLTPPQHDALTGYVELVLFEGGYAGLSLIEDGRANLCLLIRRERLRQIGSRWECVLPALLADSEHLRARLDGAVQEDVRPLALSAIPYGYSVGARPKVSPPDLWRLGDQAAVIPSFSGDGMSIALHSAELAAMAFLDGGREDAFHRALAGDLRHSMQLALPLSRALVHPVSQALAMRIAGWMPQVMSQVARRTRIPERAIDRIREGARAASTVAVMG